MTKEFFEFKEPGSEELFLKCYYRALELAEEHDIDVSEYHDRIIESLCKLTRKYLGDKAAYAMINANMHNKMHCLMRLTAPREVSVGILEVIKEPSWFAAETDLEPVFSILKTMVTENEYNSFYYYYQGYSYSEIGEILDRFPNSVRLDVEKCLRRLRMPVFLKYYL